MKLTVIAHPKSKQEKIVRLDERYFELFFNVVPQKGKANVKIIEMLSDYLKIPKSNINIVSGEKSKLKIVEIIDY